jgi:hypothetical protein
MRRFIDLIKLDRPDSLIRRHATGLPAKLAERPGMSRSSLLEFISFLRDEMQAPVRYREFFFHEILSCVHTQKCKYLLFGYLLHFCV